MLHTHEAPGALPRIFINPIERGRPDDKLTVGFAPTAMANCAVHQ